MAWKATDTLCSFPLTNPTRSLLPFTTQGGLNYNGSPDIEPYARSIRLISDKDTHLPVRVWALGATCYCGLAVRVALVPLCTACSCCPCVQAEERGLGLTRHSGKKWAGYVLAENELPEHSIYWFLPVGKLTIVLFSPAAGRALHVRSLGPARRAGQHLRSALLLVRPPRDGVE